MNIKTTIQPTSEPVSINDLKQHLGINTDDVGILNEIMRMGKSARELCERHNQCALSEKTVEVFFEKEYDMDMDLMTLIFPILPVNEITAFKSVDKKGTETDLVLNTGYYLRGGERKESYIPETVLAGELESETIGWKVTAEVGYTPQNIPSLYKDAILKIVADWYNNKGRYVPVLNDEVRGMLNQISDMPQF
jgi:uncharacterized phiE125 gp8 family phage protein